jgi:hypothetical protein
VSTELPDSLKSLETSMRQTLSAPDLVAQVLLSPKILWDASVDKAFMSGSTWDYGNSILVFCGVRVRYGGGPLRIHSTLNKPNLVGYDKRAPRHQRLSMDDRSQCNN